MSDAAMDLPEKEFEQLVIKELPGLARLASNLLSDRGLVPDVTQESFLRAVLSPPGRFTKAWLKTVTKNVAFELARRSTSRRNRERRVARPEATKSAADEAELQETAQRLRSALGALPYAYRMILTLHYLEGLKPRQIATRMAMTPAEVHKLKPMALQELRCHLDAEYGDRREWCVALIPLGARSKVAWLAGLTASIGWFVAPLLVVPILLLIYGLLFIDQGGPTGGSGSGSEVVDAPSFRERIQEASVSAVRTVPFESDAREESVAGTPPPAVSGPGIRFVEAGSGRPLPGIEVFVWDNVGMFTPEWQITAWRCSGFDDLARALGRRVRTDVDGRIAIPEFVGCLYAWAQAGIYRGGGSFSASLPLPQTIELRRHEDVKVRTLDGDGRPLGGVPVALIQKGPQGNMVVDTATTGSADGIADLAYPVAQGSTPASELVAITAFPGGEAPTVELKETDPIHSVDLVLPRTGSVEVRIVGTDGQAWLRPCGVGVFAVPAVGMASSIPGALRLSVVDGGHHLFPFVGLGRRLQVSVVPPESDLVSAQCEGPGPTKSGETTVFTVRLGQRRQKLVGRALDASRRPLAGLTITIRADRDDGEAFDHHVGTERTGSGGEFEVLPSEPIRKESKARLVCEIGQGSSSEKTVSLAVEDLRWGDVIELGDLVFDVEPIEVLAGGRVLDPLGEPLSGAKVVLFSKFFEDPRTGECVWTEVHQVTATADRNGCFEVRGARPKESLGLAASKRPYVSEDVVPIRAGESGIRLQLTESGALEGSVVPPVGIPPQQIEILVRGCDADVTRRPGGLPVGSMNSVHPESSGRFGWPILLPGLVDLEVRLEKGEPICIIDRVLVEPGRTNRDSRLQAMDLGALVLCFAVIVKDQDGKGIPGAEVTIGSDGQPGYLEVEADDKGHARIAARPPAVDVTVVAPGFRPVRRNAVASDQIVILTEPAIEVRLTLPEDLRSLGEGEKLLVWLSTASGNRSPGLRMRTGIMEAFTATHRTVSGWVPSSGDYQLCMMYSEPSGRRSAGIDCRPVFQVGTVYGVQDFVVPVRAGDIEDARRMLEDKH